MNRSQKSSKSRKKNKACGYRRLSTRSKGQKIIRMRRKKGRKII